MSTTNQVFVIKSSLTLDDIRSDFINAGAVPPSFVRIIYKNVNGRLVDSKKNLVVTTDKDIELLTKYSNRYTGKNVIEEYDWNRFTIPAASHTWDLHVTGLPNSWSKDEANSFIVEKVSEVCPTDKFSVYLSFNRETGLTNGYGSVVFDESVPEFTKKLCKLALHMTRLSEHDNFISVTWRIAPKQKTENKETKEKPKTRARAYTTAPKPEQGKKILQRQVQPKPVVSEN